MPAAVHWFMSHVNKLANATLASLRQRLGALLGPSRLKGALTKCVFGLNIKPERSLLGRSRLTTKGALPNVCIRFLNIKPERSPSWSFPAKGALTKV